MKISELLSRPQFNSVLQSLTKYPKIAWDVDATLVDSPASEKLHEFILAHPEIKHYIITARSDDYLVKSIFWELAAYPAKLSKLNFTKVITANHKLHQ